MLSIACPGTGVVSPVREYQPVVHRLRLSASPYVPTNPGQINLTLEPLDIRRTGFSPVIRYSCLHSHSYALHDQVTPPLQHAHDAPLPIHATFRPQRVNATASADNLSPAELSAQNHLTSELLRTLSRMAASKPTSWLSTQLHILFHLVTS